VRIDLKRILLWVVAALGVILLAAQVAANSSVVTALSGKPQPTVEATPIVAQNATFHLGVTSNSTATTETDGALIGTIEDTNLGRAQAELLAEGAKFNLIILSNQSIGLEGEIYKDLIKRNIRSTTGPDEGFDTSSLDCYPTCIFVPIGVLNELSVESWTYVLRHEERHTIQAGNNPNLARDFRPTMDGPFTTYAAFEEAYADDGIYVGENIYHASERMPKLKMVLGASNMATYERACQGDQTAYQDIVNIYNSKAGGKGAFETLFPPYK